MSLGLYWCTTDNGDSDFWVVAETPHDARDFFSFINGFAVDDIKAKRIRSIPDEDILTMSLSIPCDPSKEQLMEWGVEYNSSFHVFYIGKKIFRPESTVRHLMITHAKRAHTARGRSGRNASLRLVGPSST